MTEQPESTQETADRLFDETPQAMQTSISTMRDRIAVARRTLDNLENDLEFLADIAQKLVFASDMSEEDESE